MLKQQVLDVDELKTLYGAFYESNLNVSFDESLVPKNLVPLIPYARFWGHTDDAIRFKISLKAPEDVKENLALAIIEFDDELDDWLAGPEALASTQSDAYLAYSAMRMASDFMPNN